MNELTDCGDVFLRYLPHLAILFPAVMDDRVPDPNCLFQEAQVAWELDG
ncbi:MAG: hypothetical protein WAN76_13545 [Candidatus Sulfotelmatobacter sp.]